ncbi:MAG: hypothetical protein WCF23_14020 [Candidatus Nitrosopolaris sp.]
MSKYQQYPAVQEIALTWEGSAGDVNMSTSVEKDRQPNSKELLHVMIFWSVVSTTTHTPIYIVIPSKDVFDTLENQ